MACGGNALSDNEIIRALLHQNYFIDSKKWNLGNGSFGVVVRAKEQLISDKSRYRAVKLMRYIENESTSNINVSSNITRIKRYQERELEALTDDKFQSNRHIIRYYSFWLAQVEGKQILCIAMELCLCSLNKLALYNDPHHVKNEAFYKRVFPQILEGLDVIHRAGWVHRDLHPGNILIANPKPRSIKDIKIKIADFGLARQLIIPGEPPSSQRQLEPISPRFLGNAYTAQEMKTKVYDYKVDLYSAGKILSEDLGGSLWQKGNEMLARLIDDLTKYEPSERPTAREALDRFNNLGNERNVPPQQIVKSLAKNEEQEETILPIDMSMDGI